MTPPIHDITDPGAFIPTPPPLWHAWWFWLAVILGSLLVGVILFRILRQKNAIRASRSLLEQAREQLESLRTETGKLQPQTMAVRISLIVRQYLEAAFADPALFETNEEFTLRPHALEKLHPDCRAPMVSHLNKLSSLKYSPSVTSKEIAGHISGLIDEAADLLSRVEQSLSSPQPSPSA